MYHKNIRMSTTPIYCILMHIPPKPSRTWSRYSYPEHLNNNYSSKELDERRKYEILQHKHNEIKYTKNKKLADIYRGKSKIKKNWAFQKNNNVSNSNTLNLPRVNNTLIYKNDNTNKGYSCNVTRIDGNICTSTTRSNIPGPEMFICKKNIPLTRLVNKITFN